MDCIEILNKIIYNSKVIPPDGKTGGVMYLAENKTYVLFVLLENDKKTYIEVVNKLFERNKELRESYNIQTFEKTIHNELYNAKIKNYELTQTIIDDIIKQLLQTKVIEYEVIHNIKGIIFDRKIDFGDFFFCDYTNFKIYVTNTYMLGNSKTFNHVISDERLNGNMFVGIKVRARENKKAQELAYEKMRKIESVMRFFAIIYGESYDIGIFEFRSYNVDNVYIFSEDNIGESNHCSGCFGDIIWESFYEKYKVLLDELFKLIFKDKLSEIEKRILLAVDFCSRATYDRESTVGFLEAMMAIEALLQMNSDGLVTPSITYQITEYCAFLLHTTSEERKNLDKIMRNLYKIRSKISHGKQEHIDKSEFQQLLIIAVNLIIQFLSNDRLKVMKKDAELQEYIKNLKYSTKEQQNG